MARPFTTAARRTPPRYGCLLPDADPLSPPIISVTQGTPRASVAGAAILEKGAFIEPNSKLERNPR